MEPPVDLAEAEQTLARMSSLRVGSVSPDRPDENVQAPTGPTLRADDPVTKSNPAVLSVPACSDPAVDDRVKADAKTKATAEPRNTGGLPSSTPTSAPTEPEILASQGNGNPTGPEAGTSTNTCTTEMDEGQETCEGGKTKEHTKDVEGEEEGAGQPANIFIKPSPPSPDSTQDDNPSGRPSPATSLSIPEDEVVSGDAEVGLPPSGLSSHKRRGQRRVSVMCPGCGSRVTPASMSASDGTRCVGCGSRCGKRPSVDLLLSPLKRRSLRENILSPPRDADSTTSDRSSGGSSDRSSGGSIRGDGGPGRVGDGSDMDRRRFSSSTSSSASECSSPSIEPSSSERTRGRKVSRTRQPARIRTRTRASVERSLIAGTRSRRPSSPSDETNLLLRRSGTPGFGFPGLDEEYEDGASVGRTPGLPADEESDGNGTRSPSSSPPVPDAPSETPAERCQSTSSAAARAINWLMAPVRRMRKSIESMSPLPRRSPHPKSVGNKTPEPRRASSRRHGLRTPSRSVRDLSVSPAPPEFLGVFSASSRSVASPSSVRHMKSPVRSSRIGQPLQRHRKLRGNQAVAVIQISYRSRPLRRALREHMASVRAIRIFSRAKMAQAIEQVESNAPQPWKAAATTSANTHGSADSSSPYLVEEPAANSGMSLRSPAPLIATSDVARLQAPVAVTCSDCGRSLHSLEELSWHAAHSCSGREVPCPLGCPETLTASDVHRHCKEECASRTVHCVDCRLPVRKSTLEAHCLHTCKFRVSSCPQGCSKKVPMIQLTYHTKYECANAPDVLDLVRSTKSRPSLGSIMPAAGKGVNLLDADQKRAYKGLSRKIADLKKERHELSGSIPKTPVNDGSRPIDRSTLAREVQAKMQANATQYALFQTQQQLLVARAEASHSNSKHREAWKKLVEQEHTITKLRAQASELRSKITDLEDLAAMSKSKESSRSGHAKLNPESGLDLEGGISIGDLANDLETPGLQDTLLYSSIKSQTARQTVLSSTAPVSPRTAKCEATASPTSAGSKPLHGLMSSTTCASTPASTAGSVTSPSSQVLDEVREPSHADLSPVSTSSGVGRSGSQRVPPLGSLQPSGGRTADFSQEPRQPYHRHRKLEISSQTTSPHESPITSAERLVGPGGSSLAFVRTGDVPELKHPTPPSTPSGKHPTPPSTPSARMLPGTRPGAGLASPSARGRTSAYSPLKTQVGVAPLPYTSSWSCGGTTSSPVTSPRQLPSSIRAAANESLLKGSRFGSGSGFGSGGARLPPR